MSNEDVLFTLRIRKLRGANDGTYYLLKVLYALEVYKEHVSYSQVTRFVRKALLLDDEDA